MVLHPTRRTVVSLCVGAVLGSAGCLSREPEASAVRFARLSGDISVANGDDVTPNLVVVAPANDPVWSGIHELVLVNDAPDGSDLVFAWDAVPLEPGTAEGGLRVGSILADIPADAGEFVLSKIALTVHAGSDPVSYDIGRWRMHRPDAAPTFEVTGDYPASMSRGGQVAFSVQNERGADVEVTGIETGTPGLTAGNVDIAANADGGSDIAFELEYDDDYDLFGFSPRLVVEEQGERRKEALDPILVKYLDLGEDDLRRIASR